MNISMNLPGMTNKKIIDQNGKYVAPLVFDHVA